MQHALIITQIESYVSEQSGEVFRLNVLDYRERHVVLYGLSGQQVNIQTLKNQVLPAVMLSDQLEVIGDEALVIPESSLVSIVPLPSASISAILTAGKAEEILKSLSLKSC